MEGRIYNATVMNSEQERVTRTASRGRKGRNWESKISKMDTVELLWTFGGAALIGTSLYFMSFMTI
ncbi:MAG TPA: hypothetical protein VFT51_06400 [Bacillales bacterium]|nr:hypothetical protein [Bacillales bacterium]